jgi:hypothetical protein
MQQIKVVLVPKQHQHPTKHLLLNYCISHPHSTLLICPYITTTLLINHTSSNNNKGGDESRASPSSNAKLDMSASPARKQQQQQRIFSASYNLKHDSMRNIGARHIRGSAV